METWNQKLLQWMIQIHVLRSLICRCVFSLQAEAVGHFCFLWTGQFLPYYRRIPLDFNSVCCVVFTDLPENINVIYFRLFISKKAMSSLRTGLKEWVKIKFTAGVLSFLFPLIQLGEGCRETTVKLLFFYFCCKFSLFFLSTSRDQADSLFSWRFGVKLKMLFRLCFRYMTMFIFVQFVEYVGHFNHFVHNIILIIALTIHFFICLFIFVQFIILVIFVEVVDYFCYSFLCKFYSFGC